MPRLLPAAALVVLVGVASLLVWETRRLAEVAGVQEVAVRAARTEGQQQAARAELAERARSDAAAEVARLAAELASSQGEVVRLQDELRRATEQLAAVSDRARAVVEAAEQRAAAARVTNLEHLAPMPEGVRRCLQALHSCLQTEGFVGLRFLRATGLDEDGLHGVEALRTHADGLAVESLFAERVTATLERGAQRLTLRFFDGTRTADGKREPLPEDGWEVTVAPIAGQLVEARLPYLVQATGEYPPDELGRAEVRPTDVEPATRASWLDRLDQLLEDAGTDEKLRVTGFRGIDGGAFLEARLLATDELGHVRFGAGCQRLAVEVDRKARVTSLWLRSGSLQRGLATSTITAQGMRILLPDVTPEQAIDTMLGMVVYR